MSEPWQGWYHCIGSTYGTWVRGDPRGFRTRHHREHMEGDYKNPPPPGKYDRELRRSHEGMKRPPVQIPAEVRPIACRIFAEALLFYHAEVADLTIGGEHWHLLARFTHCRIKVPRRPSFVSPRSSSPATPRVGLPSRKLYAFDRDPVPRLVLGRVRSWTTRQLKEQGFFTDTDGGLWAKRPTAKPVENKNHFHFLRTEYLPRHAGEGAAVWSLLCGSGPS